MALLQQGLRQTEGRSAISTAGPGDEHETHRKLWLVRQLAGAGGVGRFWDLLTLIYMEGPPIFAVSVIALSKLTPRQIRAKMAAQAPSNRDDRVLPNSDETRSRAVCGVASNGRWVISSASAM
jgi:hypothetical protein